MDSPGNRVKTLREELSGGPLVGSCADWSYLAEVGLSTELSIVPETITPISMQFFLRTLQSPADVTIRSTPQARRKPHRDDHP